MCRLYAYLKDVIEVSGVLIPIENESNAAVDIKDEQHEHRHVHDGRHSCRKAAATNGKRTADRKAAR